MIANSSDNRADYHSMVESVNLQSFIDSNLEDDQLTTNQKHSYLKHILERLRPSEESEKDFIIGCVNNIMDILRIYGFDDTGYSTSKTQDLWIQRSKFCKNALSYVKWKTAAFYSACKKQITPPRPFHTDNELTDQDQENKILTGKAQRYIEMLSRRDPEKYESFLVSILYSKKGMPRPDTLQLKRAEIEACIKLTTKYKIDESISLIPWGDHVHKDINYFLNKETWKEEIERTVDELFKKRELLPEEIFNCFFPSTSANYINSRSCLGTVGFLLERENVDKFLPIFDINNLVKVQPIHHKQYQSIVVDTTELDDAWTETYIRMIEEQKEEVPFATPLALAEALKTRVITKGPPLLNTILKPLQKYMWKTLHSNPFFTLIGEPISDKFIQDRLGKSIKDNEIFKSIDYSDATNEIKGFASEIAINRIINCTGLHQFQEMAKTSLTKHKISYDIGPAATMAYPGHIFTRAKEGYHKEFIADQETAQLMGSITSFPILNIINATSIRWAHEVRTHRRWLLKDVPGFANGDDAVLKTDELGSIIHDKIANFVGLKKSIGKVYESNKFLNANSTTYTYNSNGYYSLIKDEKNRPIKRTIYYKDVKYVNMGLMTGMKRSGTADESIEESGNISLGPIAHELINTCPPELKEIVMKKFIMKNLKFLKEAYVPWYLPMNLGGLGLPEVGEHKSSELQLRLLRKAIENPTKFKFPQTPSMDLWLTWKVAQSTLDHIPELKDQKKVMITEELLSGNPQAITLQRVTALRCIASLYDKDARDKLINIELAQMKPKKKLTFIQNKRTHYLKSLQKFWNKVLRDPIKLPEPYKRNKLPQRHKIDERLIAIEITNNPITKKLTKEEKVRLEESYNRDYWELDGLPTEEELWL